MARQYTLSASICGVGQASQIISAFERMLDVRKAKDLPCGWQTGMNVFRWWMPIGNLTSQLFANIYMNELDQYAKHVLHIHYYIRYMDDVIVLAETKEQLQEWKEKIEAFLRDELFLDLNDKTCIRPVSMGIEFVGVRIYATHMKLRKSTVGRLKREVKKITEMYATGEMSKEDFDRRVASIKGLLAHTQSASLRGRLNLIYRDTMQKYGRPTGPETDIWKGTYEEKKLARSVRKAA